MNLIARLRIVLISFLAPHRGLFPCDVSAADRTNICKKEDLPKFQFRNVPENSLTQKPPPQEDAPSMNLANKNDKDGWCSNGTFYRDRLDKAKKRMDEAERQCRYADMEWNWNLDFKAELIMAADEELKRATKELAMAQEELDDLEQSSYRQGIPPGWLRCQFDY